MAAWIVCALCALVIVKPQEFLEPLEGLPLVYIAFFAALPAITAALIQGRIRLSLAPQVPFVLGFFGWALVVTAVKRPDMLEGQLVNLAIVAGIFLAVTVGCASAPGVRAFAITLAGCAALATAIALVQSDRPFGCFLAAPDDWEGRGELTFDGRPCETAFDCRVDAPVADGNYRCERRGPLNTTTIGGRVRYRGSLADPNELSLSITLALPLVFALAARGKPRAFRRSGMVALPPLLSDERIERAVGFLRGLPALVDLVATAAVVVLSQSRTGRLVFLAVMGFQVLRRTGAWGIVLGSIVSPAMLLFGGRGGAEAEASTDERAEILREAFEIMRATKGIGLGAGQYTDASSIGMTAHNAYVLAAAETGILGYLLFWFALYLSIKVPVVIWFRSRAGDDTRFAPALAGAMGGVVLGILFLSWTYKDILYMVMGASAALYGSSRARDPSLRVGLSWREAAVVCLAALGLLSIVYVGLWMYR